MSRIYQPANKPTTKQSNQQQQQSPQQQQQQLEVISSGKPLTPSNVKLFVNNLNNSNISASATSSLSSSYTDKQSQEDSYFTANPTNNNLKTALADDTIMSHEQLSNLINRLEHVTNRLETVASNKPAVYTNGVHKHTATANTAFHEPETVPPSVQAFDDLMSGVLISFIQMSNKIGPDVKSIADQVDKVFKYERSFLLEASKCVQPSPDMLNKFYQLFSKNIEEIAAFREKNRKSEFFNHLSAISESIGALGWIAVQPAPSPYVKEMSDAAQFYTNRVLKDYKEKDPNHASWVKLWLQLLNELQAYVKQNHTTGVVWNSQKKSASFDPSRVGSSTTTNGSVATPGGPGGPPPPPPPPNFNFNEDTDDQKKSSAATTQALFSAINKGTDITSHLKKVSDDQKTHKNTALRASNVVPATTTPSSSTKTAGLASNKSAVATKPPVFELEDKKWKIEYQNKENNLVVDKTDLKHTVYIYQCKECTITVKGKVNSILIDSCNRVGLLFDDVLSTVEFINSTNVQMQVLGRVPTVTIEKTDGCMVYLSENSLDTEIVSSKSSAMNVLLASQDGEFSEHPVPEQFKTIIDPKTKKLVTTATESC